MSKKKKARPLATRTFLVTFAVAAHRLDAPMGTINEFMTKDVIIEMPDGKDAPQWVISASAGAREIKFVRPKKKRPKKKGERTS